MKKLKELLMLPKLCHICWNVLNSKLVISQWYYNCEKTAEQVEFPAYMAISNITLKIIRQIAADIGGKLTVKLNFLSDEQEINIKGEKIIRISINLLSFCFIFRTDRLSVFHCRNLF